MIILAFLKNWPLLGGYFGSWGHALVTVAVVEWLKQESMYGMSTGTEKWLLAVGGGSTVYHFCLLTV